MVDHDSLLVTLVQQRDIYLLLACEDVSYHFLGPLEIDAISFPFIAPHLDMLTNHNSVLPFFIVYGGHKIIF
jgi:hypothetical protein